MHCPFCDIQKEEKGKILRDNKYTFVVLSDPRLMSGHLLVIPKRHVERMVELTKEEREEFFDQTIELQEKILGTVAQGCDISEHYRPFLPNGKLKVAHLHMHIRPRSLDDDLYMKVQIHEKDIFLPPTQEEFERFKNLLKE